MARNRAKGKKLAFWRPVGHAHWVKPVSMVSFHGKK